MKNDTDTPSCILPLWEGAEVDPAAAECSLSVYLPAPGKSNGAAVLIFPGGGYENLTDVHEGSEYAKLLTNVGVTTFVLRYRIHPHSLHPAPLLDAQRALRLVRSKASEFGVNPKRIGIWGSSAGGHLAATAATHFDKGDPDASDSVEQESSRPDFLILSYPVITMDAEFTHAGSRDKLIGEDAPESLAHELSCERHVTKETPPAFIFHTDDDEAVPPENSVLFYLAMRKAGVPAELHIFRSGEHGAGLAEEYSLLRSWPELMISWMRGLGLLDQ